MDRANPPGASRRRGAGGETDVPPQSTRPRVIAGAAAADVVPAGRGAVGDLLPPPLMATEVAGTGDLARDAALLHLAKQAGRFPDLDLKPLKVTDRASPRDTALAHAIVDAAVARWLTLARCIGGYCSQPWEQIEPALQGALMGGAAQILMLDRVPAYAAIDHAVQWTKVNVRSGAAGLTNAVLRKVAALRLPPERQRPFAAWNGQGDALPLSNGGVLRLAEEVFPIAMGPKLGMATSHPRAIIEAWAAQLGSEREGELRDRCLHSLAQPPIIMNLTHARVVPDRPDLLRRHTSPGHSVFLGAIEQLNDMLAEHPDVWVQDPASSRAVAMAAARCEAMGLRPRVIVDLCAGQGTKTRQLASFFPEAEIVATDTDERRREVLADSVEQISSVRPAGAPAVSMMEPGELLARCAGRADLVLLDVPCSNTGVIPRRPEARYRYSAATIAELVELQRGILTQGAGLLSRDGQAVLVYSTCSLERQENAEQVAWACAMPSPTGVGLRLVEEHQTLPAGLPGGDAAEYHDGAYAAVIART